MGHRIDRPPRLWMSSFIIVFVWLAVIIPLCVYVYPNGYKSMWSHMKEDVNDSQNATVILTEYSNTILNATAIATSCFECTDESFNVFGDIFIAEEISISGRLCVADNCTSSKRDLVTHEFLYNGDTIFTNNFTEWDGAIFGQGLFVDTILYVLDYLFVGIYNVAPTLEDISRMLDLNLWEGEWDDSTTYGIGSFAIYNKQLYQAVSNNTNNTPAIGSSVWLPMGNGSGVFNYTGPQGDGGNDAICRTASDFVVPSVNGTVNVSVTGYTGWAALQQYVFVEGSGQYQIVSIASSTMFELKNVGYLNNTPPGVVVVSGSYVTASGKIGPAVCNGINYKCETSPMYGATARLAADSAFVCNTTTTTICGGSSTIQYIQFDPSLSNWSGYVASGFAANGTYITPVTGAYRLTLILNAMITFDAISGSGWQPQPTVLLGGTSVQFNTYYVAQTAINEFRMNMILQRTRSQNAGNVLAPSWRVSIVQTNATITLLSSSSFTVASAW